MPNNLKYDEVRKTIQLVININRQEGTGLGIRIAGGRGSNPYKDDDEVRLRIKKILISILTIFC